MDGPIIGLLENLIRLVEDRYGGVAAWIVVTIPLAIMLYLLR